MKRSCLFLGLAACPIMVCASQPAKVGFDIPGGAAENTLKLFSAQSGLEVLYLTDAAAGVRTNEVRGHFTAREALDRLLAGTKLKAYQNEKTGAVRVVVSKDAATPPPTSTPPANRNDTSLESNHPPKAMITSDQPPSSTKRFAHAIAALFFGAASTFAQPAKAGAGLIEGRVFDPSRGVYVENARVTVAGTQLETYTDAAGQFRLADVPAGAAKLNVFFTGSASTTDVVDVPAGQVVHHDVTMRAAGMGRVREDGTLVLDEYTVTESRAMSGAAIAINEQRVAPNMRNVIAADEFETIVDGTPGEILKFLPGVAMDSTAGDARGIALEGVQAAYTPVTIGGFSLASTTVGATGRTVLLDNVGINNLARMELIDSPTPESPASALAGSVNLVPRSAFEVPRPTFSVGAFLTMKQHFIDFNRTPGPLLAPERKVTPGFNFSFVVPVNKKLGFSVSGNDSVQFAPEDSSVNRWYGVSNATNGTTLPDTTPDNPYNGYYSMTDGARRQHNASLGITVDYRLASADVISVSYQKSYLQSKFMVHWQQYSVGAVSGWGPTFTTGVAGRGGVSQQTTMNVTPVQTDTPTIKYRHNGAIWRSEAGFGYSTSSQKSRAGDYGYFNSTTINNNVPLTVSFEDVTRLRPGRFNITDATGRAVDPYDLSNYKLGNTSDTRVDRSSSRTTAYINLSRHFEVRGLPFAVKAGIDENREVRDNFNPTWSYTFVGPNPDGSAMQIFDPVYSQKRPDFGFPRTQWTSAAKYYDIYRQHPEYFRLDENNLYRTGVANYKYAKEVVTAPYLRGDVWLMHRRLWLVGGVRAEQTNIDAEGPLSDPTRNYARDADGNFIDADPVKAGLQPKLLIPTSDALGVSKATYLARQQKTRKEYLRFFPSINATYNITPNLLVRSAYYYSIGRPDFNQYNGGLTLPSLDSTSAISVNNPNIKPWTANTFKVRLEYYFPRVGALSIGAFRRDFKNFFATRTSPISDDLMQEYGLDPALWSDRNVTTTVNLSDHSVTNGLILDYKQALTFLPRWARGVQVFFNATALRNGSQNSQQFAGLVPRVYNYGFSISRPKWKFNANWNYRGKTRVGLFSTARGIAPETYNFYPRRLFVDVSAEYLLRDHVWLTGSVRNAIETPTDFDTYNPATPVYAHLRQETVYYATWTFGLKATF